MSYEELGSDDEAANINAPSHVFHEIPRDERSDVSSSVIEAMIAAVRDRSSPKREQLMIGLIATHRHNIDSNFDEIVDARSDLDHEDLHQMAALSILEIAAQLTIDDRSIADTDLPLARYASYRMNDLIKETKLVPESNEASYGKYRRKYRRWSEPISDRIASDTKNTAIFREINPDDDYPEQVEATDIVNRLLGLGVITDLERDVIAKRYGLGECVVYTYAQIADQHGIDASRASLVEGNALSKMRNPYLAQLPKAYSGSASRSQKIDSGLAREYTNKLRNESEVEK